MLPDDVWERIHSEACTHLATVRALHPLLDPTWIACVVLQRAWRRRSHSYLRVGEPVVLRNRVVRMPPVRGYVLIPATTYAEGLKLVCVREREGDRRFYYLRCPFDPRWAMVCTAAGHPSCH